jgi:ATP/maltotriose-dependent transcriptional regulator MalT
MGAARAALDDRQVEHGLLSQWGQPWLAGYLANVHLLADEHDAAITVNREALAQLDEGLVYQRSALLSDVARAQAGQGDVDGACATLEEALALARRQGVEVRLQHVRRAREALPPAADTLAVRHLDEQLAVA